MRRLTIKYYNILCALSTINTDIAIAVFSLLSKTYLFFCYICDGAAIPNRDKPFLRTVFVASTTVNLAF